MTIELDFQAETSLQGLQEMMVKAKELSAVLSGMNLQPNTPEAEMIASMLGQTVALILLADVPAVHVFMGAFSNMLDAFSKAAEGKEIGDTVRLFASGDGVMEIPDVKN